MHYPFLVEDPVTGVRYRLTDQQLAECSLAPLPMPWHPAQVIAEQADTPWEDSYRNAPLETVAAVRHGLDRVIMATSNLRLPEISAMLEGRGQRHLMALLRIWAKMGEALPEGMATARHVIELPEGDFLAPILVVEGSLDPAAPAAMQALFDRLKREFGSRTAASQTRAALDGTRLNALQGGLIEEITPGPADDTLRALALRDGEDCASFAAARARRLLEVGCAPRDVAVLCSKDPRHLAAAFVKQGVPLSGLPAHDPQRDVAGETARLLIIAKRDPAPSMALAGLALSPLMPWTPAEGRDLAEQVMGGDRRGVGLCEAHQEVWEMLRRSAKSGAQLRVLLNQACQALPELQGRLSAVTAQIFEELPDYDQLLREVQLDDHIAADSEQMLEGVSLWSANASPWRPCKHLIIVDFADGLYPARPGSDPMFLDGECAQIVEATGLRLQNSADRLAQSLALFDEQLQATSESLTLLIPRRGLGGERQAPSAGLALIARAIAGLEEPEHFVEDVVAQGNLLVEHHSPVSFIPEVSVPEAFMFDRDLLQLRQKDNAPAPQSPSRLDALLVSPLGWLLGEMGARDMGWAPDRIDPMIQGNLVHRVLELVFPKNSALPEDDLLDRVESAFENAIHREAPFLRDATWAMERHSLLRLSGEAATSWRDLLVRTGATIVANEVWLRGTAHGIPVLGKADMILRMPDGALVIVDHKLRTVKKQRPRLEKGWELQVGLYGEMLMTAIRVEDDGLDGLAGHPAATAYNLMRGGGALTSGVDLGSGTEEMGISIGQEAEVFLKLRLAEVRAGRIVLNTSADEKDWADLGVPAYAINNSPLVGAHMREIE